MTQLHPGSRQRSGAGFRIGSAGGYRLVVQALPGTGLPFGSYPRLLLAWLSTEIVRTRRRELELGRSMAHFLDRLGLPRSGGRGRAADSTERSARSAGKRAVVMMSFFGFATAAG